MQNVKRKQEAEVCPTCGCDMRALRMRDRQLTAALVVAGLWTLSRLVPLLFDAFAAKW